MSVTLKDPFGAALDQGLPALQLALDPERARREFKRRLPRLSGEGRLRLQAIRVTRHKPGRRCVVEYDVEVDRPGVPKHLVTLIGKVRAHRSGNEAFRLQEAIWNSGFDAQSADGVSVPEPIGVISAFQMWFQRKAQGVVSEKLVPEPGGVTLARRVAEAVHKLHCARVPTEKSHTIKEELTILRDCLRIVSEQNPQWGSRLERLMGACEHLAAATPQPVPHGIHRDFYAAQVIVDGSRLWLLDFDLYCLGDPALDIGNFIAHITEQALRQQGRADALVQIERALEDRFVELSGESTGSAVRTYTTLTLARHIFLSTKFADRQHLTEKLLALCETRLV